MITQLITKLTGDSQLASLLADAPWGGAAVYTEWAPDHSRPYVTLGFNETRDGAHMGEGEVLLDVWGDGASYVDIEPIRDRLTTLLDHAIIDTPRGPVRFFWRSDGPEQEDDPHIVRWNLDFEFRRSRTDFV